MSRPMRPSDCAETTQEAAHARALDVTQAGALQAVPDLQIRRVAEDLWQRKAIKISDDDAIELVRAVLAATQPNAAPAAEVVAAMTAEQIAFHYPNGHTTHCAARSEAHGHCSCGYEGCALSASGPARGSDTECLMAVVQAAGQRAADDDIIEHVRKLAGSRRAVDDALSAFEHRERGIAQAHIAAQLVEEVRNALAAPATAIDARHRRQRCLR